MSSIPKLVLVIGPSGVGKGTLLGLLRERHADFFYPVSVTTRAARAGETEGETYYFVSDDEFVRMKDEGELLEWAIVHGKCSYGTLKQPILDALARGQTVVREVDIQGLRSIVATLSPHQVRSIFVAPPSKDTLREHILKRQPDMPAEELARRMESAEAELAGEHEAERVITIVEGDIEASYALLESAILA